MNSYTLDTSFICSLLNKNDTNHRQAIAIFEKIPDNSYFYLPAIVELELSLFSIKSPEFTPEKIHKFLQLFDPTFVEIDNNFIKQFQKFCHQTKLKLKTNDYAVLYTAILKKSALLTFDQKLSQAHLKLSS